MVGNVQAITLPRQHGAPTDLRLRTVVMVAILVSIVSFMIAYLQDSTLLYYDAKARLLITRRVVDSPTPGLAQLGGVWLPLTHIAALPFIGVDVFYRTGLAGSLISMGAFVLTISFLYRTVKLLTNNQNAATVAAFVFGANPNILYMQSTPMTELPMYAAMMGAVYYLTRLAKDPDNYRWLLLCGIALAAGTLIRYENWVHVLACGLLLLIIGVVRRFRLKKIEGQVVYWAYGAFAGIALWLLWNAVIFGDPLSFQRGEYAKPSLWVVEGATAIGNLSFSFWTYTYAILCSVGPLAVVGAIALVPYLLYKRFTPDSLAPLTLTSMYPFFVLMIYLGQRPLDVPQLAGQPYNVRFALVMLIPVAVLLGWLASISRRSARIVVTLTLCCNALMFASYGVITYLEPSGVVGGTLGDAQRDAATWFVANYDGGALLLESYGNDEFQFSTKMPLGTFIYEGSYRIWDRALVAPHDYARWVVMRNELREPSNNFPSDKLWNLLRDDPTFQDRYALVFRNTLMEIYRLE